MVLKRGYTSWHLMVSANRLWEMEPNAKADVDVNGQTDEKSDACVASA